MPAAALAQPATTSICLPGGIPDLLPDAWVDVTVRY